MKDYKAYLFDWDGTLSESMHVWIEICRKELERYNIHADDATIANKIIGRIQKGAEELGVPAEESARLTERTKQAGQIQAIKAPLYPGAADFLRALKSRQKKLALITANFREVIDAILEKYELRDLFDVLVTKEDVEEHKPHPKALILALYKLECGKHEALMLGDNDKDIGAARNAGIDSLLYFPKEHHDIYNFEELQTNHPTYIIHTWEEALRLL